MEDMASDSVQDLALAAVKRAAPSSEEEPGKRSRVVGDEDLSILKILLPEKQVGNVIGKEGVVLKKTMEESGTRIRISAIDEIIPGTRERIATITGPISSLQIAQHLIGAVLADCNGAGPEADRSLKLLMPHASIGVVIGRGGIVIKEMMQLTGAFIKISQPSDIIAATQERILTITGPVGAVDAAQDAITRRLAAAPLAQQIKEQDYKCLKGASFGLQSMLPQQFSIPSFGAPPPGRLTAPGGGVGAAPIPYKHFMTTLADDVNPADAQAKYQEYLHHFAAASAGGCGAAGGASSPGAVSHQLPLPDRIVSGIIGKGGLVIKEIIARSGAQINVSQKDASNINGERTVTVAGQPDQVAAARHLISERCREIEAAIAKSAAAPQGSAVGAFAAPAATLAPNYGYDLAQQYPAYGYPASAQPYQAGATAPLMGGLPQAPPVQSNYNPGYLCQPPSASARQW